MVQAQWRVGDREWAMQGRLDGQRLRLVGAAPGALQARVDDEQLVIDRPGAARARPQASGAVAAALPPLRRVSGPECRA